VLLVSLIVGTSTSRTSRVLAFSRRIQTDDCMANRLGLIAQTLGQLQIGETMPNSWRRARNGNRANANKCFASSVDILFVWPLSKPTSFSA
jgi:hypothetical protein